MSLCHERYDAASNINTKYDVDVWKQIKNNYVKQVKFDMYYIYQHSCTNHYRKYKNLKQF